MWSVNSQNGKIQCKWQDLGEGHWLLRSGDHFIDCTEFDWQDNKAIDADRRLEVRIVANNGIQLELTNISDNDFRLGDILLRFDEATLNAEDYLEYIHSKWLYEAQSTVKRVGLKNDFVESNPESNMVYLLKPQQKDTGYAFAVLPPQQEDYVYFKALHRREDLQGTFGLEIRSEQSRIVPPGKTVKCSKIMFDCDCPPMLLLEKLGNRYHEALQQPLKPRAIGWNSWDDIKHDVNINNVMDNYEFTKNKAFGDKVKYFVLDDGWECSWGDWSFRPEFRSSAEVFCKNICNSGCIPGIWLAPLYAGENLMEKHPEWFARMPDGSFVEDHNAKTRRGCLDITHPEVAEHLYNIYHDLNQYGFKYYKVDFTQMVQLRTEFHDPTVGKGAIIRKTFEIIRRAVGNDAYILACAPPYESVFGLVDAARITADIQLKWSVVQFNIGSAACRWWMDRKLWNNDSDFVIIRSPEYRHTIQEWEISPFERGKYFSGKCFSATEARSWALIAVLTGDVMLGDDLTELNDAGLNALERILELAPVSKSAIPTDLFSCGHNRLPCIWQLDEPNRTIFAVFNWDGEYETHCLDLKKYGFEPDSIFTNWLTREKLYPDNDMQIKFTLEPHASLCIVCEK